jgi:hypothetical protein
LSKFASGKYAYGISDRSGFRYRLRDMRKEWNGLLVGKDEWEEKHPQLHPLRSRADRQALRDPRPETNLKEERVIQYGFNPVGFSDPFNFFDSNNLVATASVGSVTLGGDIFSSEAEEETQSDSLPRATLTGLGIAGGVGSVTISTTSGVTTYTVTVASYYGSNYFYIDGSRAATLSLSEGSTYKFDQSDSSNSGHPLRFSTTSDGTHGSGSEYTTGVTTSGTPGSSGAYTQIEVASGAPTLYYYCTNHSGMGGQINT